MRKGEIAALCGNGLSYHHHTFISKFSLDNETARVETVSETARVNRSSKREKTSLSREGSKLDKSMLEGRASVTSIGLEPKSDRGLSREKTSASRKSVTGLEKEKSNVTLISVKPGGAGEKHDKESPVKALVSATVYSEPIKIPHKMN